MTKFNGLFKGALDYAQQYRCYYRAKGTEQSLIVGATSEAQAREKADIVLKRQFKIIAAIPLTDGNGKPLKSV